MIRWFGIVVVLAASLGCAGPALTSRTIAEEPSAFIRLDTLADKRAARELAYEHPAEWSATDLAAILTHLLVQERTGLLDQKSTVQPLWTASETKQLVPGLQQAFRTAQPSEWVAFGTTRKAGIFQEVTSGGMFVKNGRLHVVIANFREQAPSGPGFPEDVRANPTRPTAGSRYTVSFEPARFVSGTKSNWMGGSSAPPSSELVVDYMAFLAEATPAAPSPSAAPVASSSSAAAPHADATLRDQLMSLQQEIDRLRRRVEEQDKELARLKSRLTELDQPAKSPR